MTWDQLLISIASLVGTTAMTSYLTDHIQRQLDYRKLKSKLDNFAGLQAVVLFGDTKYRIQSIDRHGIVMQNELQTIFVPIKRALDNVIALPSDSYDAAVRNSPTPSPLPAALPVDQQVSQMMDEMLAQRFSAILDRVATEYNIAALEGGNEPKPAAPKPPRGDNSASRANTYPRHHNGKRRYPPRSDTPLNTK
jgi:hypothetical protein